MDSVFILVIIFSLICSLLFYAIVLHFRKKSEEAYLQLLQEQNKNIEERARQIAEEHLKEIESHPSIQPCPAAPEDGFDLNQPRENHIPYLAAVLDEIGCKIEVDKEGSVSFKYQGEEFFLEYNGVYLRIWDPVWARIDTDNPNFRDVLKAVNEANYGFGPTVVFTLPDTSGSVALHSRYDIYFPSFAKNDPGFLKMSLNLFFDTKHNLSRHLRDSNEKGTALPNPALLNPLIPSSN